MFGFQQILESMPKARKKSEDTQQVSELELDMMQMLELSDR